MLLQRISEQDEKNISLIYKSLYCLAKICDNWNVIEFLYQQNIVQKLRIITN